MNTAINCPKCDELIDVPSALATQFDKTTRVELENKFKADLQKFKKEAEEHALKKATEDLSLKLEEKEQERKRDRERVEQLQKDRSEMIDEITKLKVIDADREIEMKKRLLEESQKLEEQISKREHEKSTLEKAALEKTIEDMKKALEEANRKGSPKSQQQQGEIFELVIEKILRENFSHDEITPVEKGIKGADIKHNVKTPKGYNAGLILWEFKRAQDWGKDWIPKLKQNSREAKAEICVIVSTVLPKDMQENFGMRDDVWICSIDVVLPLAFLLRKSLLDVARQKAIAVNSENKAGQLYSYVTSNEFFQQVKAIIDVYKAQKTQIQRERMAFEKSWKERDIQAERLIATTAGIVGSMEGKIQSTLHIPDLDLLDSGA